jgi:ferrochelatase
MVFEHVAVLLMAYGGPLSLDDVEPYLLDVRVGRPTPKTLVDKVRERYALIGGRSPLLDWTRAQAGALEHALNETYPGMQVFVGMRHWHPYIRDVLPQIVASGATDLIAIPMAPHYSRISVGAYRKTLEDALAAHRHRLRVVYVERWGTEPMFVRAVAQKVHKALIAFPQDVRDQVMVAFTAHSLPQRVVDMGDPYPEELERSARAIAQTAGLTRWRLTYQSAGASSGPWLGPDVGDVVREWAAMGHHHVLVVPIGFVCDHVEVLYDIDIELKRTADQVGVHLSRTESLNDDPGLIDALASLVTRAVSASGEKERNRVCFG